MSTISNLHWQCSQKAAIQTKRTCIVAESGMWNHSWESLSNFCLIICFRFWSSRFEVQKNIQELESFQRFYQSRMIWLHFKLEAVTDMESAFVLSCLKFLFKVSMQTKAFHCCVFIAASHCLFSVQILNQTLSFSHHLVYIMLGTSLL